MKKLICLILTMAGIAAFVYAPPASTAASTDRTITGIAAGSFPGGASFAGVDLNSFEIATGVITDADGSAAGVFHAELAGRSLLGTARRITLEGTVMQGTAASGSGSFSGLARLDLGDGVPAVSGIPFNVETNAGSMVLTIHSTVLPSAALTRGSVDTE